MRTWYIEDAGGGCKAFSEIVVLVSEEPKEIYTAPIPLFWSTGESMEDLVRKIIVQLMEKARVKKTDHILVCSGNIFFSLHNWLKNERYNWETTKMDGLAHDVAENTFQAQLVKAGFPSYIKLVGRDYKYFYQLIEAWVLSQKERHIYLKDRALRQKPKKDKYILKANGFLKVNCSSCQRDILPYTPMVEIKFKKGGKKIKRCYHLNCSPEKPKRNNLKAFLANFKNQEISGVLAFCKHPRTCLLCQQTIEVGEEGFFAYLNQDLITFHKQCLSLTPTKTELD